MQVFCKGSEVFVVVQEAAVMCLRNGGDEDVHGWDGNALASELITGSIGEGPDSIGDLKRLKCFEPFMHRIVFIPVPAALEEFENNNICGGDGKGVERCHDGLLELLVPGLPEADDPGGCIDEQPTGHRAVSSDRRGRGRMIRNCR
jgi:hypothetical protein